MIIRRKLFANTTLIKVLDPVKNNVAKNLRSATGLKNKRIAKELKQGAEALQDYTGQAKNSFIDPSGVGHNTISYARTVRSKGDPGKFTGDLFDGMIDSSSVKIRKGAKRAKTRSVNPNTEKDSILLRQHDLAAFNRKKDRGSDVMDIAGEEFKKVVKTNGTSRIERVGPWLPGFNRV